MGESRINSDSIIHVIKVATSIISKALNIYDNSIENEARKYAIEAWSENRFKYRYPSFGSSSRELLSEQVCVDVILTLTSRLIRHDLVSPSLHQILALFNSQISLEGMLLWTSISP